MGDADLLVPSAQAEPALAALDAAGWRAAGEFAARRGRHLLLNNAIALRNGRSAEIDLHWQPVHETVSLAVERQLWANALPISVSGITALRPDSSALLMQVMLHGLRRNFKAPLRWIADALMILRKEGTRIDWEWLLAAGRDGRTSYRLGLGLRFLAEHFAFDIPASVMADSARARPSLVERLENRFVLGDRPSQFSTGSYKAALLLRMLSGKRRAAVPDLLWREVLRQVGAARG